MEHTFAPGFVDFRWRCSTPGLGGFKVALDAIKGLRRQWSHELGARGIRVVTLKMGGALVD